MKRFFQSSLNLNEGNLIFATLAYLLLPYLLFFAGWLKWWIALSLCLAVLIPLSRRWSKIAAVETFPMGQIAALTLLVLVTTALCGAGGVGHQMEDWDKHNTILRDLTMQPWPVRYSISGGIYPLTYYIAYYLPAAAVGKLLGWTAANAALWLWTFLGLALAGLWFCALLPKKAGIWAPLLFLLFAGLDILGFLLMSGLLSAVGWDPQPFGDLEWWGQGWNYMSLASVIFWFPGQGIVAWLASALVLKIAREEALPRSAGVFAWALTALWVPFVTLGLLPFLLLLFRRPLPSRREWLDHLASGLVLLCMGLFYLAKIYPSLSSDIVGKPIISGWVWSFTSDLMEIAMLAILWPLFWLLECGIYGLLARKLLTESAERRILAIALITLGVIPLYRYGYYNDMSFKTSLPAIFILAVLVGRALFNEQSLQRAWRIALVALLIVGSVTAVIEYSWQVEGIVQRGAAWQLPSTQSLVDLNGIYNWQFTKKMDERGDEFASFLRQYLGSNESVFFQGLGK